MNKLQTVLDALEGMAQEPVAYVVALKGCPISMTVPVNRIDELAAMHNAPLYAAPVAVQAVPAVTDEMVSRFLRWKLPRGFYPDGGITFSMKGRYEGFPLPDCWPNGKNLLTADQAREMLEHVLAAAPVAKGEV